MRTETVLSGGGGGGGSGRVEKYAIFASGKQCIFLKKKKKKNPQQWDFWVSVHPWRIHVDVWQNQYNIVK